MRHNETRPRSVATSTLMSGEAAASASGHEASLASHAIQPQNAAMPANRAKNAQEESRVAAWAVLIPAQQEYTAVVMPTTSR